jgi:hypothetical protein
MSRQPQSSPIENALRDLRERTLDHLQSEFAKLVYLASTRDYNTGAYEHDGLTFRFTSCVAQVALAAAHREVFANVALKPLETLTGELQRYIESHCIAPDGLLTVWTELEVYRMLLPVGANTTLSGRLFMSNLAAALAIVGEFWKGRSERSRPGVWPQQSPAQ